MCNHFQWLISAQYITTKLHLKLTVVGALGLITSTIVYYIYELVKHSPYSIGQRWPETERQHNWEWSFTRGVGTGFEFWPAQWWRDCDSERLEWGGCSADLLSRRGVHHLIGAVVLVSPLALTGDPNNGSQGSVVSRSTESAEVVLGKQRQPFLDEILSTSPPKIVFIQRSCCFLRHFNCVFYCRWCIKDSVLFAKRIDRIQEKKCIARNVS